MHKFDDVQMSFSKLSISNPSHLSSLTPAPVTSASLVKKSPGTPYKETSRYFLRALDEKNYGLEDIPQIMATIKFLEQEAEKLFKCEYNEKKISSVERANYNFKNEKLQLEPSHSPFYPILSYQDIEDLEPRDKQLIDNILRTAEVTKLELPEFNFLIDKNNSREYAFELCFGFGTDYVNTCNQLFNECQMKKLLPRDCSNIIAGMLGSTRFDVKLTVYFDKMKDPDTWHEQDGEAWIFHKVGTTNVQRDLVDFDTAERIYYVEDWPLTGLLCGSYSQYSVVERERLERTIVSWLCSQITFLAFQNLRDTQCTKVKKALNRLLFVLKGWYTGLLLGESFDPDSNNEMFKDL